MVSKLLPGIKNKVGIELAVSDCADEATQKKYGLAPWRRALFRDVPEKFIIELRRGGVEAAATCQAFWDLLEPATAVRAAASSSGAGKAKRDAYASPSPATDPSAAKKQKARVES